NVSVAGITTDAIHTNDWKIADGRALRETDIKYSNDVCLLGPDIVDKIFPGIDPIGKVVRIDNRPFKVIGVLERQQALFGDSRDNYAIIPITTFQSIYGKRNRSINITVLSYSETDYNKVIKAAIGEIKKNRKEKLVERIHFDILSIDYL